MSCAIFEAFAAATEVGRRIDNLVQALPAAFGPLKMEVLENEDELSLWVPQSYTAHLKVPSLSAGRKSAGQLAVHFDLGRPELERSDWQGARQALVVIAYGVSYDDGWVGPQLAVGADGRLGYEASEALERFAGGRLLGTGAPRSGRWADADWLYAVPLAVLDEDEMLDAQIVAPVTSLLVLDATPEQALTATRALAWPD